MASKTPNNYSVVLESKPAAVAGVCEQLLSKLKSSDFSQKDIFAIHLALEEAFINAVRHGNKMDPSKQIKIDYSISNDKIEISVTDEGIGFKPNSVPDPRCGENIYKTDGRGLFLIRSYMDVVDFNEAGNCIHMVRFVQKLKSPDKTKRNG
jgi:serine/threonine-protein kinase RsbW